MNYMGDILIVLVSSDCRVDEPSSVELIITKISVVCCKAVIWKSRPALAHRHTLQLNQAVTELFSKVMNSKSNAFQK